MALMAEMLGQLGVQRRLRVPLLSSISRLASHSSGTSCLSQFAVWTDRWIRACGGLSVYKKFFLTFEKGRKMVRADPQTRESFRRSA